MSKESLVVANCPSCGSPDIRQVRGKWVGTYKGETYAVKDLEYFSCPNCHEKIYPPAAMHQIQEASPAYAELRGKHSGRRAAPKPAA